MSISVDWNLNYDSEAAAQALHKRIEETVKRLCDTILEYARVEVSEYPEVAGTLTAKMTSLVQTGVVSGIVSSDHWMAWLAEWGSGSLMDTSNVDLAAYMASPFWNPARKSNVITGRPAGPYEGLDGEMHDKHTGYLEGVDLEELSQNDPGFQAWMQHVGLTDDAFQPKRPLHFMRNAILDNKNLIMDQIKLVIEEFPLGAFFV